MSTAFILFPVKVVFAVICWCNIIIIFRCIFSKNYFKWNTT